MSERADSDFLEDITLAIESINSYISGMSYEDFLEDKKTQDAVVHNLEIQRTSLKIRFAV